MPRIKITGGLPKADFGFNMTTTTTLNPFDGMKFDPNWAKNMPDMDGPPIDHDPDMDAPSNPPNPFKQVGLQPFADKEANERASWSNKQKKAFDKSLLGMQSDPRQRAMYASWYNKEHPNFLTKIANTKAFKFVDKYGPMFEAATTIAQPIIDFVNDRKAQKRWDRWFKQSSLPDNMFSAKSASMSGNRGDYDVNTGIFRPNEIGFKSKGMYTNQFQYPGNVVAYGGTPINDEQDMKKIKIKITGTSQPMMYMGGNAFMQGDGRIDQDDQYSPWRINQYRNYLESQQPADAYSNLFNNVSSMKNKVSSIFKGYGGLEEMATGGQPMTYSGQLGYGINLGQRRIYTDMPTAKSDSISKRLSPVPRSKANIEAEKDETAWGDLDSDGAMEHMVIGGERHVNGGTPLNVPEGTFIFSDTKDMTIKDENALKLFGMAPNKKGYTPAQIAKKYDINKYKAIIEDPAVDEMRKGTAQLMIKSYQKKLAQLALIQEQMKGFPQGIPDVVKKVMPELSQVQQQQPQGMMPQQENNMQMEVPEEMPQGQEGLPQNAMAFGGLVRSYATGGVSDDTTTTTTLPVGFYDQTYSPDNPASLSDPDYDRFLELLDKLATKDADGKYYISSLKPGDQDELAKLTTKFGFSRPDEGGKKGFSLVQSSTPGYTWIDKINGVDKKVGFFGGMTPEMYENKFINALYPDRAANMTALQKRRLFLKNLDIDADQYTDAQLSDVKGFYTNKDFFRDVFYPAYTKKLNAGSYRKIKGDDWQIGLEHYDAFKWRAETPPPKKAPENKFVCVDGSVQKYDAAKHAGLPIYSTYPEAQQACYTKPGEVPNRTPIKMPFAYMTPDLVNMAAAAMVPPKKYLPWSPQLPYQPSDVVFEDWRGKAAERQGLMNKMMNQMNTYSPGSATAANLSFLAGQGAEGLIKDISDVDARNVATANQYAQMEANRQDKNMAANLGRAEDLYKGNVIANQQYDNARRAYINNLAKTFGQAWKNRMYLGLLNNVNTMYPVDPKSGFSLFTGGKGWDNFGGASASGKYSAKDFQSLYDMYKGYGYSDKAAEDAAIKQIEGSSSAKSSDDNKPNLADYQTLLGS